VLPRQCNLEDPLGDLLEPRLAIEAEKAGLRVENAVAVRGKPREQLLRALEPESPVDDREAKEVEPLDGRRGGGALGTFSAQEPYLATPDRDMRSRAVGAGRRGCLAGKEKTRRTGGIRRVENQWGQVST